MTDQQLREKIKKIKIRVLDMAYKSEKSVHIGGVFSMIDVLSTLYLRYLKIDAANPQDQDRDRFILSKGHCAVGLYAVLAEAGLVDEETIATFMQNGTKLAAHPVRHEELGIESSNGSLGQGFSMAVGIAKAAKIKNKAFHTYVLIGNGESNEGSVWEAAMSAANWQLDNLTVILDQNRMQSDGNSAGVLNVENMAQRWESFGFYVCEIDGHNICEIEKAFEAPTGGKPKIIVANTIKGHGISFMENRAEWHHNRLTQSNYALAVEEVMSGD